jgi:SNF2 family DNA or RNA helicase
MARVHRIGQTKVVHVYRLVTAGTAHTADDIMFIITHTYIY